MNRDNFEYQNSKNILLVFDYRLADAAKILMIGLRECLSGSVVVHCIVDQDTYSSREEFLSLAEKIDLSVRIYLESGLFKHLNTKARAKISYEKYLFERCLPDIIEYLLYIDVDVVPVRNFDEIFINNFEQPFAAIALDDFISRKFIRWNSVANSGVVLINTNSWKKHGFDKKSYDFIVKFSNQEDLYDELVLNFLYYDKWFRLDSRFNTSYIKTFFMLSHKKRSRISLVHFIGPRKPWKKHIFSPLAYRYLRKYRKRARRCEIAG
jgi:lipopolysaccharide biosynthesis glycosyltransferase